MLTADVVVIGGGCVGTSALYHLAHLGSRDVILLEADTLGAGSTSKAAGGIRLQHDDVVNTQLSLRSFPEFERFEELTGVPIDFKQVGYLFVLDNERDLAQLLPRRRHPARARHPHRGARRRGRPRDGAAAEHRRRARGDILALEGYAAPEAVVQGYARAARRMGAKSRSAPGWWTSSPTPTGSVECGPRAAPSARAPWSSLRASARRSWPRWSTSISRCTARLTVYYSSAGLGIPQPSPLVVDFSTSFYFHSEGSGLVFGGREATLEELSQPPPSTGCRGSPTPRSSRRGGGTRR